MLIDICCACKYFVCDNIPIIFRSSYIFLKLGGIDKHDQSDVVCKYRFLMKTQAEVGGKKNTILTIKLNWFCFQHTPMNERNQVLTGFSILDSLYSETTNTLIST